MWNNKIELYRFIFSIGIALMHYGNFDGFYIGVDFFFIVSGYLLARDVYKNGGGLKYLY